MFDLGLEGWVRFGERELGAHRPRNQEGSLRLRLHLVPRAASAPEPRAQARSATWHTCCSVNYLLLSPASQPPGQETWTAGFLQPPLGTGCFLLSDSP